MARDSARATRRIYICLGLSVSATEQVMDSPARRFDRMLDPVTADGPVRVFTLLQTMPGQCCSTSVSRVASTSLHGEIASVDSSQRSSTLRSASPTSSKTGPPLGASDTGWANRGAFLCEGHMVDAPVLRKARRIVELSDRETRAIATTNADSGPSPKPPAASGEASASCCRWQPLRRASLLTHHENRARAATHPSAARYGTSSSLSATHSLGLLVRRPSPLVDAIAHSHQ